MFSLQDSEIDVSFCMFKAKVQLSLHTKEPILLCAKIAIVLLSFFHSHRFFSPLFFFTIKPEECQDKKRRIAAPPSVKFLFYASFITTLNLTVCFLLCT